MGTSDISRYALSVSVAAALLTACGGWQPPSAPGRGATQRPRR